MYRVRASVYAKRLYVDHTNVVFTVMSNDISYILSAIRKYYIDKGLCKGSDVVQTSLIQKIDVYYVPDTNFNFDAHIPSALRHVIIQGDQHE